MLIRYNVKTWATQEWFDNNAPCITYWQHDTLTDKRSPFKQPKKRNHVQILCCGCRIVQRSGYNGNLIGLCPYHEYMLVAYLCIKRRENMALYMSESDIHHQIRYNYDGRIHSHACRRLNPLFKEWLRLSRRSAEICPERYKNTYGFNRAWSKHEKALDEIRARFCRQIPLCIE